jgi:L-lactate utilization protein LutB
VASRLEESIDVRVVIEPRGLAVIPRGQQIDGRDFGERVGHVAPLSKPAHDLKPRVHADRTEIRDVRRPAPREIGRHAWGAFPFGKAGEEVEDARRFV